MSYLLALLLAAGGQAGAPTQQVVTPPSGGISPLAWVIICALTTALVAVSKVGWSVYGDLKETRKQLSDIYEEPAQLLKALRVGLDLPKTPTAHPPPGGTQGGQP